MKIIYMLCFILLGTISSFAQCPTGSLILSSQAEVDDFGANYPNCVLLPSSLIINTDSDINDLSPLSGIQEVDGSLVISGDFGDPSQLTNLDGLNIITLNSLSIIENQALTEIDALSSVTTLQNGSIAIYDNPLLTNLNGVANIVPEGNGNTGELNGNLEIYNNPLVTSIDVFDNITKVNFELEITDMPGLTSLMGLDNITEVEDLLIANNPNLNNLNGLNALEEVTQNATIDDNSNLSNLSGLNDLVEVGNVFDIDGNNQLTNLSGLNSLTHVGTNLPAFGSGGHLIIRNNQNLSSLNGLNALEDTGGDFIIKDLDNLTDITAVTSLTSVGGKLEIGNNDALTDLTGLHNVTEANANGNSLIGVLIGGNELLPNLDGLSGLTDITNRLEINFNPNLDNINGLSSLSTVNNITLIGNDILQDLTGLEGVNSSDVTVRDNPALQNLSGLNNITIIGNLIIDNNTSLTDISALSNTTTVGGNLEILENPNLTTLNGLENLNSVNGSLDIDDNNSLTDLSALNNLTSVGFDLAIFSNQNLIQIDGFNSLNSVGGTINISGNDNMQSIDGFNNLTQVSDDLNIVGNDNIIKISGFSSLNQIDRSLLINNNTVLKEIYAFENLTSVNRFFTISNNDALEDLNAFQKLTSIGDNMTIQLNDSLNDITGLRQLEAIGTEEFDLQATVFIQFNNTLSNINGLQKLDMTTVDDLRIQFNPKLSICNLTNFCTYLSNPANSRNISGNLGDCVDDTAILNVCSSCATTTTWDGNAWSNGQPNATAKAVFDGNYTETGNLETCDLEVRPNATLDIEGVLKVNGNLDNFGEVHFKSDVSGSGQLDEVPATSIVDCNINTERFIPVATEDTRAYRFLTSSVNTRNYIYNNWQEGGNSPAGLGTHITGDINGNNGFDPTATGNPSMFTFDNSFTGNQNNAWNPIANTDRMNLNAGSAYRIFIRGDRNYDLNSNPPDAPNTDITLRAKGTMLTGDQTFSLSQVQDYYSLVGNPYQAIVNINDVQSTNMNTNFYWVWDPNMSTRGAYVAVDLSTGNSQTPAGNPSSSVADQFVMPGQSFFVQTVNNGAADITFTESAKDVNATPTAVFSDDGTVSINLKLYKTTDLNNDELESDALQINFNDQFANAVTIEDADKLGNPDENLARVNNGEFLSIEKRAMPNDGETLAIFTDGYTATDYTFVTTISNMPQDVSAYLIDDHTGEQTLLNKGQDQISFTAGPSSPGSVATDRFSIEFEIETFGVEDNEVADNFKVYPNPVENNQVTIQAPNMSGEVDISLSNMLGQRVMSTKGELSGNGEMTLNIGDQQSGVYFIEVGQDGQTVKERLIIK